jgi:signal transduction histidine kinase
MPHRLAEIQERKRIARELHDTVLQPFIAASMLLQTVANNLRRTDPACGGAAATAVDDIVGLTRGALTEARRAVMNLRDGVLHDSSLVVGVETLLCQILDPPRIPFQLVHTGAVRGLSNDAEQHTMRICREALWNIVRHAKASRVSVTLAYEAACLRLTIADDGVGFHVERHLDARSGQFGLLGMHERAMEARGQLSIRSSDGHGTVIVLTVPVADSSLAAIVA